MKPSSKRLLLAGLWMIPAGLLPAQDAGAQGDPAAGRRAYMVCAGCHGFLAEGNQTVAAPKLAGLEAWYLKRQIDYYHRGVRGGAPGDTHGARMASMAHAVPDQRAVEDVVAYIRSLPDTIPQAMLAGDAVRGEALYATCSACHGPQGEGNEALSAPRLTRMDDWYLVAQLRAYLEGTRGTHAEDVYGRQMAPAVNVLTGDQALLDVAAYIGTFD